jgi:hypothetical protein
MDRLQTLYDAGECLVDSAIYYRNGVVRRLAVTDDGIAVGEETTLDDLLTVAEGDRVGLCEATRCETEEQLIVGGETTWEGEG